MSRNVQIVLLCEDSQHEAFARRFLGEVGWSTRRIRVLKAPKGQGSGEQFVRNRFPEELKAYRSHKHRVSIALLVVIDGDKIGGKGRLNELDDACRESGIPCRSSEEHVLVFVPTWCIETWFAYLEGEEVDEAERDYPRLPRPGGCGQHAKTLAAMCRTRDLRKPAPSSLVAACEEYTRWVSG